MLAVNRTVFAYRLAKDVKFRIERNGNACGHLLYFQLERSPLFSHSPELIIVNLGRWQGGHFGRTVIQKRSSAAANRKG